jgi:hypothetical protein
MEYGLRTEVSHKLIREGSENTAYGLQDEVSHSELRTDRAEREERRGDVRCLQ